MKEEKHIRVGIPVIISKVICDPLLSSVLFLPVSVSPENVHSIFDKMVFKDPKYIVKHHNVNWLLVHFGEDSPVTLKSVSSHDRPVSSTVLSSKTPGFQPPHLLRDVCGF